MKNFVTAIQNYTNYSFLFIFTELQKQNEKYSPLFFLTLLLNTVKIES